MANRKLIVGLGNPGKKYEGTRHNLGFMVIEWLAQDLKLDLKLSSFTEGLIAKKEIDGQEIYFLMPATFVNNSGIAIKQIVSKKDIEPSQVLVVCDELNLPFGTVRLKPEGSAGGHNGLKSTIEYLQTDKFPRLRMGINHPGNPSVVVDYVLDDFTKEEKKQLGSFVEQAGACCELWMKEGMAKAMETFNKR